MKNSFKNEEGMKVKPGDLYLYKSKTSFACNTWLILTVDDKWRSGRVTMICIGSNTGVKGYRAQHSLHMLKAEYEKLV